MNITESEFNTICVGDLCDIFIDKYNNTQLGVIINKQKAIENNVTIIECNSGDKLLQKQVMMQYWEEIKQVKIPEPQYMLKIVHILGMSNGYWFPDSRIRKIYPNTITRKYVQCYLVNLDNEIRQQNKECEL